MYYWLLEKNKTVHYVPMKVFVHNLYETVSEQESIDSMIKRYREVKYLLIDDFSMTTRSDWQKDMLLDLIDHRYEYEKPTLITTNLKFEEMSKSFDERISTRVFDKKNILIQDWETNYRK